MLQIDQQLKQEFYEFLNTQFIMSIAVSADNKHPRPYGSGY